MSARDKTSAAHVGYTLDRVMTGVLAGWNVVTRRTKNESDNSRLVFFMYKALSDVDPMFLAGLAKDGWNVTMTHNREPPEVSARLAVSVDQREKFIIRSTTVDAVFDGTS